jgi:hypothetical protein
LVTGDAIVAAARGYEGTHYEYGGSSPIGFDCSGLTQYVYRTTAGVRLPRTAAAQQHVGVAAPLDDLAPGDLVFYGSPAHHVGIAVGHGTGHMIAAPHTGDVVKEQAIYPTPSNARRVLTTATGGGTVAGVRRLTPTEIAALCCNMTGDVDRAATAAAVADAESSRWPDARCWNVRGSNGRYACYPGYSRASQGRPPATVKAASYDRGLWQLNSRSHPEVSDADADNPIKAVSAVFHSSHGFADFHEWVTFTSGAYKATLGGYHQECADLLAKGPSAIAAAMANVGRLFVDPAGAAGAAAKAAGQLGGPWAVLYNGETWVRVLEVVGGVGCLVAGAFMLHSDLIRPEIARAARAVSLSR